MAFYLHLCAGKICIFFVMNFAGPEKSDGIIFCCVFTFFDDNKSFRFVCILLSHGNTWTQRVITIIIMDSRQAVDTDLEFSVCGGVVLVTRCDFAIVSATCFLLICDDTYRQEHELLSSYIPTHFSSPFISPLVTNSHISSSRNDYSLSSRHRIANEWVYSSYHGSFLFLWVHSCGDNVMLAKVRDLPRLHKTGILTLLYI